MCLTGCFAGELDPEETYVPRSGDERRIGQAVEMAMSLVGAAPGEIVALQQQGPAFAATYETDEDERLEVAGLLDDVGAQVTDVCRWTENTCVPLSPQYIWDEGPTRSAI
jgi:hypothetical protein